MKLNRNIIHPRNFEGRYFHSAREYRNFSLVPNEIPLQHIPRIRVGAFSTFNVLFSALEGRDFPERVINLHIYLSLSLVPTWRITRGNLRSRHDAVIRSLQVLFPIPFPIDLGANRSVKEFTRLPTFAYRITSPVSPSARCLLG